MHKHTATRSKHHSLRARVYHWLERPDRHATGPRLFEWALISLIIANVGAVVLETVAPLYQRWQTAFDLFELGSLMLFTLEYSARLWVAPEHPDHATRWAWVRTPAAMIDLLAIAPMLLGFIVPMDLRVLRIFRVLRLLKLTRYSTALGLLWAVFEEEAGAFFACFFILMVMLIVAATGAWLVEHEAQPVDFGSIPAAMWWAVATLTTVGYGDVTPVTPLGKVFASLITVIGIGMAALPAGIIASGMNAQLRRRRLSLEHQFRKALLDGNLCEKDEVDIETLRRELGLSVRTADAVRQEVMAQSLSQALPGFCACCGQRLPGAGRG